MSNEKRIPFTVEQAFNASRRDKHSTWSEILARREIVFEQQKALNHG